MDQLTHAEADVIEERRQQLTREGYDDRHDDSDNDRGDLARAAACYAIAVGLSDKARAHVSLSPNDDLAEINLLARIWPRGWLRDLNLKTRRRDLVRAGALIIAEIERFDRAAADQAR
jgi:hypothetical protein